METLADLVADARDRDGQFLEIADRSTPYSYRDFCPSVWKAGNLLSHYGVHPGGAMAVATGASVGEAGDPVGPIATPLRAILGGTILGATVDTAPETSVDDGALVAPASDLGRYETAPGCTVLAFGDVPADPGVVHFERETWSENPVAPPESVAPDDVAIDDGEDTWTHGRLVTAAEGIVEAHDFGTGDTVELREPLISAGALVAGVLAPMLAGATVTVGIEGDLVVSNAASGMAVVDPEEVA